MQKKASQRSSMSAKFLDVGIRPLDLFSERGNGFEDLPKVCNPTQVFYAARNRLNTSRVSVLNRSISS